MDIQKVIEALNELKKESNEIIDSYEHTAWKNKATNLIVRVYGKDSLQINQIAGMRYHSISFLNKYKKEASDFVEGLIKEIDRFGVPETIEKDDKKQLHINITQTQNQKTQINLSLIIDSIQEELKGGQLKELQAIIDEKETEPIEKKNKIINTLKKFGGDVATNIIANILTNPNLYS